MLPLVYGNAIKNGAANTVAYNPGGTASNTYCANFVNHADQTITAPWITKSTGGSGVNKGMGINVTSAELLWQDAQGLITAVGISSDGDYLTLTVGKDATTQVGNAVIAAKAGSTIVWSWHIWVTKQTFATADLTTVATGSHNYKVTPVNIGWLGNKVSPGYCPFYQWGRKDPFIPGTSTTANTNHTVYNINGGTVTGMTYIDINDCSIGDNIKNPTTFYRHNSTYGPCKTTYFNMWDAMQPYNIASPWTNISTPTKKTVYDPCPACFCMPTYNLYYYMKGNSTNWDSTNKGKTWSGSITSGDPIFFPASGARACNVGNGVHNGNILSAGTYGYYWSATPQLNSGNSQTEVCPSLNFYSSKWLEQAYKRAYGNTVRAVVEE